MIRWQSILGLALAALLPSSAAGEIPTDDDSRARWAEQARHLDRWVRGGEVEPRWLDDGSSFWFREKTAQGERVVLVDPEAGGEPAPFEPPEKTSVPAPRTVRQSPGVGIPPVLEVLSPDGRWWLTEIGHDLAVRASDSQDDEPDPSRRLTDDGTGDAFWSVEQGIWSPDGRWVVAWKEDVRGVPRLPVMRWDTTPETLDWHPYPRTGDPMQRFEPGLFEVATGRRIALDLGEEDDGSDRWLFFVGWRRADTEAGRGPQLLLMTLDRTYRDLRLLAIDPAGGEGTATVLEVLRERSETFVEGLRFWGLWQGLLTPLGDGQRFVWLSERSGWRHAELWDFEGGKLRDLTRGDFEVQSVLAVAEAVAEDEGWVYLMANAEPGRPYDTHLYRVPLAGGEPERLTETVGEHTVTLSPSRRFFLDRHATPTRPPTTELRRIDGSLVRVLSEGVVDPAVPFRPPERFVATAADGETPLHGVLYKPWDFDPERRYPVVDAIYNGPFITWAPQGFLEPYALEAQALAQHGFVVMMVDGRGTPERGKAFQDVVYGRFGAHEVADHAAVLEQLARDRPWLDLERVGIYGVSWGAYMATRAVLQRGDLFRAAVALNGVTDLLNHPSGSIEGYMGMPDENPEGYAAGSNVALAPELGGALLLVHGTADVNAPLSSTLRLVAALQKAGHDPELVLLPEEAHALSEAAEEIYDRVRLGFLRRHLGGPIDG